MLPFFVSFFCTIPIIFLSFSYYIPVVPIEFFLRKSRYIFAPTASGTASAVGSRKEIDALCCGKNLSKKG